MIDTQPDFQMLTTAYGSGFSLPAVTVLEAYTVGFQRPYHLLCCGLKDCFLFM